MKEINVQVSGWEFLLEPEARWLAVECLLLATRFKLDFKRVYAGAIGDALVAWQKDASKTPGILHRAAYQGMMVATDEVRLEYLSARAHLPDLHDNEIIPLGRALSFMVAGASKQTAISKVIKQYRRIRADIRDFNMGDTQKVTPIELWPKGYRFLSVDSFRQRFKQYEPILPYVYVYTNNREYNAWVDLIPEDKNPIVLPDDYEVWNRFFGDKLILSRRIRMRPPAQPISLNFQ